MSKTDTSFVNPLPGLPHVESPFFSELFEAKKDHPYFDIAQQLANLGYAIIDFPDPEIESLAGDVIQDLEGRFNMDAYFAGKPWKGKRRLQDAWQFSRAVKQIAVNEGILDILRFCYGKPAFPFQTLNFPVGSQQHVHTDSIHFNSIPGRFMCGVWVALEDVDAQNGPLIYYPGSHRLPIYENDQYGVYADPNQPHDQKVYHGAWRRIIEKYGFEKEELYLLKGKALIWTANLLHGGEMVRTPGRTRWSQVTHYFFEGCRYTTPMHSERLEDRIHYRQPLRIPGSDV